VSGDELVDIVDEEDRVVGQATRRETRERRLRHRSVYVLLFNTAGQLFVHRRTTTKDIYPGYHDIAFGGVVGAGEDFETAARRELGEEAGVTDARLRRVLGFRFDDEANHVNGVVYTATYDGPLRLQASEVEGGQWMDLDQVVDLSQREPICPDGIEALRLYLDRLNQVRSTV
jgi:isopentenyldiphosphate isomerase